MPPSTPLPSFDSLPLDKNGPPGNAWGLFGKNDQLGMLNLLTPATIAEAAKEIREGIRVNLAYPLDKPSAPTFERQAFQHEVLNRAPMTMNDDVLHLNTQSSTQWDGFRHYGYQTAKKFFNGHSQEEFSNSDVLGINVWVENGGIIGRGILLDWADWAERHGISTTPLQSSAVPVADLKALVTEQNIDIHPGDILFIRSGFTASYNSLSDSDRAAFPHRKPFGLLGLEATQDSLRWLWENAFAAVAGDSPSFERAPATGSYNHPDVSCHQWLLAGWGMPIGEMFDLEELSVQCKKLGRYSFFLSSVPLNVPGGVASPVNAVAIF